jgi:hypothetical protein
MVGEFGLFARRARVQREDGNPQGHGRHHQVLVQRVALAEDGNMEEHDGEQLAALGEDKGDVVNVGQRGVAKGGREGVCESDEKQGW